MRTVVRKRARKSVGIVTAVAVLGGVLLSAAATISPRDDATIGPPAAGVRPNKTALVSVSSRSVAANGASASSAVSADGRYVAFVSESSNLVAKDTNRAPDVFVRDRKLKRTTRVSVGARGVQANGASVGASISADGRWVAYSSAASNLVRADTNRVADVFLFDRAESRTSRVSVSKRGLQGNAGSAYPALSADGRWVAFQSGASNLIASDTNATVDVFLHGRDGTTRRVSVGKDAAQGNGASINASVSDDGRFVAFQSGASNLIARDTNGVNDVFVRDLAAKKTRRVSTGARRAQFAAGAGNPAISGSGRYVAFHTSVVPAGKPVPRDNTYGQVYVHDRRTGQTRLVSRPVSGGFSGGTASAPSISRDGRRVGYLLSASGAVRAAELFVRDMRSGQAIRVGLTPAGARARGRAVGGTLSADGRHVVFDSLAADLVAGDRNGVADTFVRDLRDFEADAIPS